MEDWRYSSTHRNALKPESTMNVLIFFVQCFIRTRKSIVVFEGAPGLTRLSFWQDWYTVMRRLTTCRLTKDRIYDGGPIILYWYNGPSSYDRPDIRTTWVATKILVLTYDQSLELRPECRSRLKRVSACAVVNKDPRCVRKCQPEPRYACLWT
jgi:hypothetical protein